MNKVQLLRFFSGPLAAILILLFVDLDPTNPMVTRMAAVTVWICIWWVTEVVHLAITSLIPLVALPLLGIMDSKTVSGQYIDNIIFLFIGGFLMAFAIEKWGLHKRIAFAILKKLGTNVFGILAGVMFTAFLLSMWISNTATVLMMISAVYAIIKQLEIAIADKKKQQRFAAALLLGLAFSATIGGMATLVGTPTNMIFIKVFHEYYPASKEVSFVDWFKIAFPISLLFECICFLILKSFIIPKELVFNTESLDFSTAKKELGKKSYEEKVVIGVFLLTVFLWFFRQDINIDFFVIPGWSESLSFKNLIHDSTIAIFAALCLFLIPSKKGEGNILTWDDATKLPFDIILLFGSGFALAKGFEVSGLSGWLAGKLMFLKGQNIWVIILCICLVVTVISEFASNVASIQLVLPILVSLQKVLEINPLFLMIPATLAASLGFMLPVATAPNTIVFSSKNIKVNQMIFSGFLLDAIGILLISSAVLLLM